jgi:hypothetical protein
LTIRPCHAAHNSSVQWRNEISVPQAAPLPTDGDLAL